MLLLDDVLSELDARRQAFVLNHIQGGQIFITCCEEEKLEGLGGGRGLPHPRGRSGIAPNRSNSTVPDRPSNAVEKRNGSRRQKEFLCPL